MTIFEHKSGVDLNFHAANEFSVLTQIDQVLRGVDHCLELEKF